MCGFDVQDKPEAEVRERIYTEGCLIRINQWVQSNLYWVGGIALGVAFVQLLGMGESHRVTLVVSELGWVDLDLRCSLG